MTDGLEIPAFLTAPRKKKRRMKPPETPWHMPELKESRFARRQRAAEHDRLVLAAIRNNCYTFHRIRKELNNDEIETNQISNAIRRLIKARLVKKAGRRYYGR